MTHLLKVTRSGWRCDCGHSYEGPAGQARQEARLHLEPVVDKPSHPDKGMEAWMNSAARVRVKHAERERDKALAEAERLRNKVQALRALLTSQRPVPTDSLPEGPGADKEEGTQ